MIAILVSIIVGLLGTLSATTLYYRGKIATLEDLHMNEKIAEHVRGFNDGWDQGNEYGHRQARYEAIKNNSPTY